MGCLIPFSEEDFVEIERQNYLFHQHNIREKILIINNKCRDIINVNQGVHNLYISTLNPNYFFAINNMGGVLGYTLNNSSYLVLNLDYKTINIKKIISTFAHEYHHVIRNQYFKNYRNNKKVLFDHIIEEGMAENFVLKVLDKNHLNLWAKKCSYEELLNNQSYLIKNLYEKNISTIYSIMHGDKFNDLPLWLGYSYGYYFIRFILDYTNYTIEDITVKDRDFFLNYISIFKKNLEYNIKI